MTREIRLTKTYLVVLQRILVYSRIASLLHLLLLQFLNIWRKHVPRVLWISLARCLCRPLALAVGEGTRKRVRLNLNIR